MDESTKLTRANYLVKYYSALALIPDFYNYGDWGAVEAEIWEGLIEEARRSPDERVGALEVVVDLLDQEHQRAVKAKIEENRKKESENT